MRCPYCYKNIKDMPKHLRSSEKCKHKHHRGLADNFLQLLRDQQAKEAE